MCGKNIVDEDDFDRVIPLYFPHDRKEAEVLLSKLSNITSSSPQCDDSAMTFFCKAAYQTCDYNRTDLFPTSNDCVQLRDNTCKDEWKKILSVAPTLACCDLYNPNSTCPDQFGKFCGICAPLCSEFSQYGEATTVAIDVMFAISMILGNIITGAIVFVTAFFKRKTM